jgi:hypothetical protein
MPAVLRLNLRALVGRHRSPSPLCRMSPWACATCAAGGVERGALQLQHTAMLAMVAAASGHRLDEKRTLASFEGP